MTDTTVVTKGERTYEVPGIWIAGFCTANRCSPRDAIDWWVYQTDLDDKEEALT